MDGTPTSRDCQRHSSKVAKQALAAQQKAKELAQAAAAAGDPEERQKLLNQALEKEIEAGALGKTASYLQSGSMQGLLAGGSLGAGTGIGLGTLVGVLVAGTTSLATGGLGAGLGAGIGLLHGPFVNLGQITGEGIRKLTGTIPGWKATKEQRRSLEKMIRGVHEEDRPSEANLIAMQESEQASFRSESTANPPRVTSRPSDEPSWTKSAASYLPSTVHQDMLPQEQLTDKQSLQDDCQPANLKGDVTESSSRPGVETVKRDTKKVSNIHGPSQVSASRRQVKPKPQRSTREKFLEETPENTVANRTTTQRCNTESRQAKRSLSVTLTSPPKTRQPRKLALREKPATPPVRRTQPSRGPPKLEIRSH